MAPPRPKHVRAADVDMIAVPTVGKSPYAVGLYRALLKSAEQIPLSIVVMINKDSEARAVNEQLDEAGLLSTCNVIGSQGMNLAEQWRHALRLALYYRCPRLHLFNDDVVLRSGAVPAMSTVMNASRNITMAGYDYFDSMPEEVIDFQGFQPARGSYREGGIGGFAFAVHTEHPNLPEPDAQFEWWGGDDDWVWQIVELGGLCAVARGIPVRHPCPETSAIHYPELAEAKARDHARLLAKWGKAW